MNLTKNFTLVEMLRSASAEKAGFVEQYNPSQEVIENLRDLCVHILQPLRDAIGQSIFVGSGYRCPRLNKSVGGKPNSQHLVGQAADLQATSKMSNAQLYNKIQELNLPFDQLIWEFGDDHEPAWVHVSYGPKNRREVLRIR